MLAAVITKPGGPEVFEIQEIEDPKFGNEDVLIQVKASALNRADTLQRKGRYPSPVGIRSDVPGLEMAGIILDVVDQLIPSLQRTEISRKIRVDFFSEII